MTYEAEKIRPYGESTEPKGAQVEKMFDAIARQYDLLNHTLSFGLDFYWRKKGLFALKDKRPAVILDIATGTGDLAIQAFRHLRPEKIVGIDLSEGMLQIGQEKVAEAGLSAQITMEAQDCMNLSFEDNSFDAVMVAFGVRNFENPDRGLQEILRVLKPGGRLMILELSSPEHFPVKQGYQIYSKWIIPMIGWWLSKSKEAYTYLPHSIAAFPQNEAMKRMLEANGFRDVYYKKLSLGICGLYVGEK
ncbi:MAG: bifunctional demethylmenaquinone methyltransferase/2-methoxy-6-polyprenyl-1,4-benzoquinol methylase UbiE [Dysgonamonadaceae bacterium]|jgi:demethylmenaquinone methyltransferase/2-methoxy-6-polyprenyl-1,4-benzoquinol methylase|nr:bifunctional demethylmenaquinone methyltransferase/2-methoxy-6-polyprenyl-1,4-benzoquinol methylase UbiE [Dysgonamonadaceae bacterium]